MSVINVTVTNAGAANVAVSNGSTFNATVGNGGAVNVSLGTISPGNATVVSGTVTINSTTTLAPGSNATVTNKGTAYAAVLDFGIPTGAAGPQGPAGTNGVTPTLAIGNVTTLSSGENATVNATTTNGGANVTLSFGIPRGQDGNGTSNLTLSSSTPAALGTASAGSANEAARGDHVHELPNLTVLGAAAANHAHNYVTALNNLTGALTLAAGANVTLTANGSTLTIASTASGGIGPDDPVDGGLYEGFIPGNTVTITTQPTAQTASNGAATFSVVATSTPGGTLSYQWEKQDGGFGDFAAVSGATSATLVLSGLLNTVDDGDRYRVVVSATNAVSVTSNSVLLTVPANVITITTQPTNQAASGGAATFTAAASVAPAGTPTYQWQRSNDAGVNWANVAGATSATLSLSGLTVEADGDARFRVVVSAVNAGSVTSNAATLTVEANNTIAITQQPTNQTASGGEATFSVAATSSPAGTPTYQWQRREFSSAGAAWSAKSEPSNRNWQGVAYGNGVWVVVSLGSNRVAVSTDNAATWGEHSLAATATSQYGICHGSGGFVAVTYGDPYAHTSPDGVSWTQRSLPADRLWVSVAHGGGRYVAVAFNSDTAATSTDGATWSQGTLPAASQWRSIAYGGGTFVAIASGGAIAATSTDGLTWAQRTLPASASWYSVAYGRGRFVAVASGGAIAATSTDGVTWTQRALPASGDWYSVTYGGGKFVAVRQYSDAIAISTDGESWSAVTGVYSGIGVAYGDGTFVATSGQGMSRSVPSTAFTNVTGATSSTLPLAGLTADDDHGDQYRAVISATGAASVTSQSATLTVTG